jgi:N-acetylmuramoyl-L-alanine amidase
MTRLFVLLFLVLAGQAFGWNVVVIDAGHGGHDRGGSPGHPQPEKVLTLDVSKRLNAILRARGVKTVMTRTTDDFVSLPRRVQIGNARKNALFVSVHFNAAPRKGAQGYETFYYSRGSSRAAHRIQAQLMKTHRTENRGVKRRGFYVLRHSRNPAVLVECGFLSNKREAALCRTSRRLRKRSPGGLFLQDNPVLRQSCGLKKPKP